MLTIPFKVSADSNLRLSDVAKSYSTTIKDIARCNNCYSNIPTFIRQLPGVKETGYVYLPVPNNGGITNATDWYVKNNRGSNTLTVNNSSYSTIGSEYLLSGSGSNVILNIGGNSIAMPCYPVSLSDSLQVNHNSNPVAYRTEPFINYVNSGPRTVSASFNLHREMMGPGGMGYIDQIINTIEAACYPIASASNSVPASLKVGNSLHISGVITGGVQVAFSGPIIDGKYNVYDISFTITEVKNAIVMFGTKLNAGSYF